MVTSFEGLFASMDVVPLFGAEFTVYAPIVVLIVGLLSFFNVYARLLKIIGIESEDAITGGCSMCHKLDADDIELIAIGKKLVSSQIRNFHLQGASQRDFSGSGKRILSSAVPCDDASSSFASGDVENPLSICNSGRGPIGGGRAAVVHKNASRGTEVDLSDMASKISGAKNTSAQGKSDGWSSSDPLVDSETVGWGALRSGVSKQNSITNVKPADSARYAPVGAESPKFSTGFQGSQETDSNIGAALKSYGGRYKR